MSAPAQPMPCELCLRPGAEFRGHVWRKVAGRGLARVAVWQCPITDTECSRIGVEMVKLKVAGKVARAIGLGRPD